jgi:hypothetical protein
MVSTNLKIVFGKVVISACFITFNHILYIFRDIILIFYRYSKFYFLNTFFSLLEQNKLIFENCSFNSFFLENTKNNMCI